GVPHLVELLKHPKTAVRGAAAIVLAELGPVASAGASGIAAATATETEEGLRFLLVTALGRVGAAGKPHTDVLAKALTSPSAVVRYAAADALLALDPEDDRAVAVLVELVKPVVGPRPPTVVPVTGTSDVSRPRRGRVVHEVAADLLFEVDPEAA